MASVISGALLRTQSDERLIALSRTGHQRAFEAIVERYRAELSRSVHRFLPSASVEDVLQQTHLEAWKALSGGTEVRELRAWLHRIARNAAIAVASRGYDYQELRDALQVTPGPEEELERREAVRRALRGIAELPDRQREALLAVAVGGRSHAEVAFDLGITDTAARQLVRRARVSLQALATIITPPPLVLWAARAGHTIVAGKTAAGAGLGGSLTGPAVKVGVIAIAVGGVAVGVAPIRHALAPPVPPAHHHHRHARTSHPPGYLTATLRLPTATSGVGTTQPVSALTGPASTKRHAAHHVRSVSANPVGKTLPAAPAGTPLPTPAPTSPTSPTPTTTPAPTPTAAAPPKPEGLAALIAWAIAHQSQLPAGASTSSGWSSAGQSTPGSNGAPSSPGQSQQAGESHQCAGSSTPGSAGGRVSGSESSTGCGATGAFRWTASGR